MATAKKTAAQQTPAEKAPAKKAAAKKATKSYDGFSAEERDAMKQRAKELKAAEQKDPEGFVRGKIAELTGTDRTIAERLHEIIRENGPTLVPRTYYGMPAYAKDGKVLCFITPATKFKTRYLTLGFEQVAQLDDGTMWPTSYAITELTPAVEKQVAELVRRAVA
ncbi:iron chaperone [Streptomyces sp. NPDC050418]|uniref:iron chaperone n=1 Tax=Streptomyces sp. NPDC050418 TaxID=3365612 RepID=UPI0037B7894F